MSVGAMYKSGMSGRTLASDINLAIASPTLQDGGPPRKADLDHWTKKPPPQVGRFTIAPAVQRVPPAMRPLAHIRDATQSASIYASTAPSALAATAASVGRAASAARDRSESASMAGLSTRSAAGSMEVSGPALSDPDGISAAVNTMRKFRGLVDNMAKKEGLYKPPAEVAMRDKPTLEPTARLGASATAGGSATSSGRRSASRKGGARGGAGTGGEDEDLELGVFKDSTVPLTSPLLGKAPTSLATAIAASAAGSSVVGTLFVKRELLLKATMVCAKWCRIVNTEYSGSAYEPCKITLEMQRTFYTPFLNDMHEATVGDFSFRTEPSPTTIVANVGALNMMIQQGATDFDEHLLPKQVSNRKRRFKIIEGPKIDPLAPSASASGAIVPFLPGQARPMSGTSRASSAGRGGGSAATGGSSTALTVKSPPGKGELSSAIVRSASATGLRGHSALLSAGSNDGASSMTTLSAKQREKLAEAAIMEAEEEYEAPMVWKGESLISKSTMDYTELMKEKGKAMIRAGVKLREAALRGDTTAMARLIIRGEPVWFDPRPWYYRDIHRVEPTLGETPEVNPYVVKTDHVVKPPVDWAHDDGMTALMHAATVSQVESVKALLQMGADIHKKCKDGYTAVDVSTAQVQEASAAVKRHERGAVLWRRRAADTLKTLDARSLLEVAQAGDVKRARFLLEHMEADVNEANQYGMTPLHFAVMNCDYEMSELLIKYGGNSRARNNLGQTPLTLIDDLERKRLRDKMREAFDGGRKEDIERRKKLAHRMKLDAAERELLVTFEKKLKALTRGTTASKTLGTITKMTREAATKVRPLSASERGRSTEKKRPGSASSLSHSHSASLGASTGRGTARPASASVTRSRPASASPRPGSASSTARSAGAAATMDVKPLSLEMTSMRPELHPSDKIKLKASSTTISPPKARMMDLYDDSAKRHVRDFVALKMKAETTRAARATAEAVSLGAKLPDVTSPLRPAAKMTIAGMKAAGVTGDTAASNAAYADSVMYGEFYTATAPPADDRKFDVWFKAHVGKAAYKR